jgi:hypothetical protein
MYFYKSKGKQVLDLTGNLILTHNDRLIKARVTSAGPSRVRNASFVDNIAGAGLKRKIKATISVIAFIWGPSTALTEKETNKVMADDFINHKKGTKTT